MYQRATEAIIAKLKDSDVTYIVETFKKTSIEAPGPIVIHGAELDFHADLSDFKSFCDQGSGAKSFPCSYFCSKNKVASPFSVEVCEIYIKLWRCYFAYSLEYLKFCIIDLY